MSHTIIIRGRDSGSSAGVVATEDGGAAVVEITYTPSHALTPEQQGNKVAKLIRLAEKIRNIESYAD